MKRYTLALLLLLAGCGDSDDSGHAPVQVGPLPDTVIGVTNLDSVGYRLVVGTLDANTWEITETPVCDPMPMVPCAELIYLVPDSGMVTHQFWLKDLSGQVLVLSTSFPKVPTVYVRILPGPYVQWALESSGPWM